MVFKSYSHSGVCGVADESLEMESWLGRSDCSLVASWTVL